LLFSSTGSFSDTGVQTVILTATGYGTPVHVGSFTMTPEIVGPAPLGGSSCDFLLAVK
jgi:hypothetical protein